MLKISYAGCLGLSPAILAQFTLEMRVAAQSCAKNSLKTPFGKVQGYLRSLMLINLKSLSPVLVMISSMSVPICNRVHATQDNCGKITTFRGVAVFDVRLRRPP